MIKDHVGGIRDPLKQDQINYIRNNWLGSIFFSAVDSQSEELVALLYLVLATITDVDTDLRGRFVSFKVTPSNDRVLCVYVSSMYRTREQIARGRFFE